MVHYAATLKENKRNRKRGGGRGGSSSVGSYYKTAKKKKQKQQNYSSSSYDPFGDFDHEEEDDDDKEGFGVEWNNSWNTNDINEAEEEEEYPSMHSRGKRERKETAVKDDEQSHHFFSKKSLLDPKFSLITKQQTKSSQKQKQQSQKEEEFDSTSKNDLFQRLCIGAGITRPSKIQAMAWPTILQGHDAIVADQTGSGKTLAYLIPLLQQILYSSSSSTKRTVFGSPQILILTPTSELADQIHSVCCQISQSLSSSSSVDIPSFRSFVITATGRKSTNIRDQIRHLRSSVVDILISTPGRIGTILRTRDSGGLDFTDLRHIVLDEVDVLLMDANTNNNNNNNNDDDDDNAEQGFGSQLRAIGAATSSVSHKTQYIFVTATLPDSIVQTVRREFPSIHQIRGPGLHRVASTVHEQLIDVSVPKSSNNRNKQLCLDIKTNQLLQSIRLYKSHLTLIFCNTVEHCRVVENVLRRNDRNGSLYKVYSYHNAMTPQARNRNLASFINHHKDNNDKDNHNYNDNNNDNYDDMDRILICTDRAARGVDFDASPIDHVLLFDFPKDPAEYVRRVGRTARAGRQGKCTIFAYGWQLPIARKILKMGSQKLDPSSMLLEDNYDEEDENVEYQGGALRRKQKQEEGKKDQRRRLNQKKKKKDGDESLIRGNIQEGKFWK